MTTSSSGGSSHLCTVTTLQRDGSPHVVPMGIVVDPDDRPRLGDHLAAARRRWPTCAGADPRVAVCQVDRRRWSTVEGTAEVLDDPDSVAEAVRRYAERYRQPRENPERVALRITITRVIGNV